MVDDVVPVHLYSLNGGYPVKPRLHCIGERATDALMLGAERGVEDHVGLQGVDGVVRLRGR